MDRGERRSTIARRNLKRKLKDDFRENHPKIDLSLSSSQHQDLLSDITAQVQVLTASFSWSKTDRSAAKRATHLLSELAKNEELVNLIVDCGAVPSLVMHLLSPPEDVCSKHLEHEVEKGSAFTIGLLAVKTEHQQLIVDAGALPHLVALLKRRKNGSNSRAVHGVSRRAADAITNLAHENINIKSRVRIEGGIPPLVELLDSTDVKVQRAAAGALRTLALKNDEN